MAYTLTLTEEDIRAINFVGHRYRWSDALRRMDVGVNEIPEHEAWTIHEGFEEDTEGGHSYFPMLDQHSELAGKLYKFMDEIV